MALDIPTTKEIDDTIIASLQSSLNQTIPLLPKSFIRVLSKTLAGIFILLWKRSGFTFQQIFVATATIDETDINGVITSPLTNWGELINIGAPVAATNAELTIDITVTSQIGFLPTNTQLIGADNGVTYLTLGSVALSAPTVSVVVKASSDQSGGGGEGVIGNLPNGSVLNFANPLGTVDRQTLVTAQTVTGADGESEEAYRNRIKDRFQQVPQGGALADYKQWAEETPGIINAYPYTSNCPGQVDTFIEATVESSGDPDGVPTSAQLAAALLNQQVDPVTGIPDRTPANALPNTFPITRLGFDVNVSGLNVVNPSEVQSEITDALTEFFLGREPFIDGLTVSPRRDRITESAVGGVVEDIVSAAGGIFSNAVLLKDGTPINIFTLGQGEKAKVLTVTFV